MNINNYQNWFIRYVEKFGDIPEIILKKEHSFRVEKNINNIFEMLQLSQEHVKLADFIGLFHDIGRFEQWIIYKTFYDDNSIDHADFGANILMKGNVLNNLITIRNYDKIIYKSVMYHNKLVIPNYISLKDEEIFDKKSNLHDDLNNKYNSIMSLYSMALRDADKIDILQQYLLSDYFLQTDYLPVSKEVSKYFFSNKNINKQDRKNLNDIVVLRLSFINDINLVNALTLIRDYSLIDKISLVFPDRKNLREYFNYANNRLNYLIDENKGHQYVLKK